MTATVFIDGAAGTTGLEIRERLADRGDIALLQLPEEARKDVRARREVLNESDLVILCLPDEAAREAVDMVESPAVRIIDASTAHRTASDWVYGFPELATEQRARISGAMRVSNPGCYATGFLALVRPLVHAGILPADFPVTVNAMSGYSGGGKAMIEEFENRSSPCHVSTVVRTYGLTLAHKHVPEMQKHARLTHPPLFAPSVGRFYRGMMVEVPLQLRALPGKAAVVDLHAALAKGYNGETLIEVADFPATIETLDAEAMRLNDGMKLFVFGNDKTQHARMVAVFDNLGKGAAGAAVQNLNLMLELPEFEGLFPIAAGS